MNRSKIVFLLFISLSLESCMSGLLLQVKKQDYTSLPAIVYITNTPAKYKTEILIRDFSISGIIVAKKGKEGEVLVSMVNEFGLKYFDAILNGPDTKMIYCIQSLDKKILKNILLHDLSVLFIPSSKGGFEEGTYKLSSYSYQWSEIENERQLIKEYDKKKLVTTFMKTLEGEYEVSHPNIDIEILLKLI